MDYDKRIILCQAADFLFIGKEIAKTRPVAVISNDKNKAKADPIRTLDKSRLVKHIGELGKTEIAAIEKAIKIHLAL